MVSRRRSCGGAPSWTPRASPMASATPATAAAVWTAIEVVRSIGSLAGTLASHDWTLVIMATVLPR